MVTAFKFALTFERWNPGQGSLTLTNSIIYISKLVLALNLRAALFMKDAE